MKNLNTIADNRVIAFYRNKEDAIIASTILQRKLGLDKEQIELITPSTANMEEKLEGDSKSIAKELLKLHIVYACVGLAIGMVIAHLLVLFGPTATQSNPVFTYIALSSPSLFLGLFIAALRSLKPEHDHANQMAVSAGDKNLVTLVVKPTDSGIDQAAVKEEIENTACLKVA